MTFTWGETSVVVDVQYPAIVAPVHFQTRGETQGGGAKVYDYGVNVYHIIIELRVKTAAKIAELRSFFMSTTTFSKETFTITPDPGHDIGAGAGAAITARLWDDDWEEKMVNWQKFPPTLRFRKENA